MLANEHRGKAWSWKSGVRRSCSQGPLSFQSQILRGAMHNTPHNITMFSLALAICTGISGSIENSDSDPATGPARIESIEGFLYYSNTGQFSSNIIDNPSFRLWNVPEAGGSATGFSRDTFVKVAISGPANTFAGDLTVRLHAFVGEREVDETVVVGIFNADGLVYRGFWLYGTGCSLIRIRVELHESGSQVFAEVEKQLPFRCGE